jgi:hypothetical protein
VPPKLNYTSKAIAINFLRVYDWSLLYTFIYSLYCSHGAMIQFKGYP